METLQVVVGLLDTVQNEVSEGNLEGGVQKVLQAEKVLGGLSEFGGTRFVGLMGRRAANVREGILEGVKGCWGKLVVVDIHGKRIRILNEAEGENLHYLMQVVLIDGG